MSSLAGRTWMVRWALFALFPALLVAQAAAPSEFEVASVKPLPDSMEFHNTILNIAHGTFNADYAALRQLVGVAYGIQRVRVEGGPAWMDTERYRIVARGGNAEATDDQVREMIRQLLAERFKLLVHHGTKQSPVYTLLPGKESVKLKEVENAGAPAASPGPGQFGAKIDFRNMPVTGLVNFLANSLGSPVLDQTGLQGRYNFSLEWAPPGRAADPSNPNPGPSLVEAVQEQLGLRMEAKKGPVEILVVDHAEKATEN